MHEMRTRKFISNSHDFHDFHNKINDFKGNFLLINEIPNFLTKKRVVDHLLP